MEAIEFKAKIKDGQIRIPERFRQYIGENARVIILADQRASHADIVDRLLSNPCRMKDFTPLSRDEIYERQ